MARQLWIAIRLCLVTMFITGVVYPAVVTGFAQVLFKDKADGALLRERGRVVGSALIGQAFTRPEYFHGRPSAAGSGYDAAASGGSNLGPTSRRLLEEVSKRADAIRRENGLSPTSSVPVDAVTASGSGLDPHITPAYAELQVARVARIRGVDAGSVRALVERHTDGRVFDVLGEPRVNVLELNLALDEELR